MWALLSLRPEEGCPAGAAARGMEDREHPLPKWDEAVVRNRGPCATRFPSRT